MTLLSYLPIALAVYAASIPICALIYLHMWVSQCFDEFNDAPFPNRYYARMTWCDVVRGVICAFTPVLNTCFAVMFLAVKVTIWLGDKLSAPVFKNSQATCPTDEQ